MATTTTRRPETTQILNHSQPPRTFPFTAFLRHTHRHSLLPPDGTAATSANGTSNDNTTGGGGRGPSLVCKHWLRGLCKKGEHCEFLHEYNLRKMPECNFFTRNGYCSNGEECLYLHIDPQSKLPPCPHYDQGFCPLGPRCAKKHVRRSICLFYLAGFCPDGPACKAGAHPRWRTDLDRPRARSEVAREEGEIGREDDAAGRGDGGAGRSGFDAMSRDGRDDRGHGDRRFGPGGRGGKWRDRGGGRRFRGRGH